MDKYMRKIIKTDKRLLNKYKTLMLTEKPW